MSGERLPTNLLEANIHNSDDNTNANPIWLQSPSHPDSNEVNMEENNSKELTELLSKLLTAYNKYNGNNEASSLPPVRRSNFWKRSNFWRKRSNFWRRDLDSQEYEQLM
ncbi:unnamed protein product [Adineta steineri]|uniref:Uncharacterized protein n=1 Tax=Adineta steineri TaxID=433720 RepID=A0A813MS42_9BILA|nr:unnamed protein product [Adineta steineri]CAF0906244.1 unnamed protein product [Adineta steineri]CAF0912174.1 unnamed protein product [Adineta steineri]CAF0996169.1 unnamed protein product [Adineta steineri]CAF1319435.1 unnamed protein product [Adineta steineri]